MSQNEAGILAIFRYLDDVTAAIKKIRGRADFAEHEVFTPTSYHDIEHASGFSSSPVKWFTLTGALLGVTAGFSLALATDFDWPLIVGGKSAGIYSIFAYVVIGFECTILLGAIATIIGMLWMGRIPNPKATILDTRLTNDRFAIFLPNVSTGSPQAQLLKECGAEEIKVVGGEA
jgi:hypothetical protein